MADAGKELAIFGVVYASALALVLIIRLPAHYRYVSSEVMPRHTPKLLNSLPIPVLRPAHCLATGGVLLLSLLLTAAYPRSALWPFAAMLLSVIYFAQLIDFHEIRRKTNTIPVILAILACANLCSESRTDLPARGAIFTIQLLIAQLYFSAAIQKLRTSGLRWADGRTLRAWLVHYALLRRVGKPLCCIPGPTLSRLAATGTVLFEATFVMVLFFPALAWVYVPLALLFHAFIALSMRIHYWLWLVPSYAIFILPFLHELHVW